MNPFQLQADLTSHWFDMIGDITRSGGEVGQSRARTADSPARHSTPASPKSETSLADLWRPWVTPIKLAPPKPAPIAANLFQPNPMTLMAPWLGQYSAAPTWPSSMAPFFAVPQIPMPFWPGATSNPIASMWGSPGMAGVNPFFQATNPMLQAGWAAAFAPRLSGASAMNPLDPLRVMMPWLSAISVATGTASPQASMLADAASLWSRAASANPFASAFAIPGMPFSQHAVGFDFSQWPFFQGRR